MLTSAQEAVKDNSNVADGAAAEVARTSLLSYLGGLASRTYGRALGADVVGSQAPRSFRSTRSRRPANS